MTDNRCHPTPARASRDRRLTYTLCPALTCVSWGRWLSCTLCPAVSGGAPWDRWLCDPVVPSLRRCWVTPVAVLYSLFSRPKRCPLRHVPGTAPPPVLGGSFWGRRLSYTSLNRRPLRLVAVWHPKVRPSPLMPLEAGDSLTPFSSLIRRCPLRPVAGVTSPACFCTGRA